ncbi:hypothetical protein PR048_031166 [Dryococelus australis]|uniref:Uncharacterized protein n=1 Tax=Dryococelus australis TaxID=614101 RepID=A0ABQ9G4H3_9NEOP|nr:hypothetical protein PR048_031166 [Dryococelus australis]
MGRCSISLGKNRTLFRFNVTQLREHEEFEHVAVDIPSFASSCKSCNSLASKRSLLSTTLCTVDFGIPNCKLRRANDAFGLRLQEAIGYSRVCTIKYAYPAWDDNSFCLIPRRPTLSTAPLIFNVELCWTTAHAHEMWQVYSPTGPAAQHPRGDYLVPRTQAALATKISSIASDTPGSRWPIALAVTYLATGSTANKENSRISQQPFGHEARFPEPRATNQRTPPRLQPRRTVVQSPAGPLLDSHKWESCRTMPLVGGSSRGYPVSPAFAFRRCSIPRSTLIGSQNLLVRSRPTLFTESLRSFDTPCRTVNQYRLFTGRRNDRTGETGDPRENPSTSGSLTTTPLLGGGGGKDEWRFKVREHNTWFKKRVSPADHTLASHHGIPGSIPGRVTEPSQVPDDSAGRRVFSRIPSSPPPPHSGATPYSPQSPSSALKTSLLRATQHTLSTSLQTQWQLLFCSVESAVKIAALPPICSAPSEQRRERDRESTLSHNLARVLLRALSCSRSVQLRQPLSRFSPTTDDKRREIINRIRLERASQKQSSDTHKTPYDRVKRRRERKINLKTSERVDNVLAGEVKSYYVLEMMAARLDEVVSTTEKESHKLIKRMISTAENGFYLDGDEMDRGVCLNPIQNCSGSLRFEGIENI